MGQNTILAIDYGTKFIGLAYGNRDKGQVFTIPILKIPHKDIQAPYQSKSIFKEIKKIVKIHTIQKILIGIPLTPELEDSEFCLEVKSFKKNLEKYLKFANIPHRPTFEYYEESMTSYLAEKHPELKDLTRQKRKKYIDTYSAKLMLEEYFA